MPLVSLIFYGIYIFFQAYFTTAELENFDDSFARNTKMQSPLFNSPSYALAILIKWTGCERLPKSQETELTFQFN